MPATITHRVGLSRNLTAAEVDENFDNLNDYTGVVETAAGAAQSTAVSAQSTANSAAVTASTAEATAATALSTAQNAQTTANAKVSPGLASASGLTLSAESKLAGRGSGAGGGALQEITLGTNLTMSGTTLHASGGGGGATAYGDLVDDTTVDLPTVNTPLAAALGLKANSASPIFSGTITHGGSMITPPNAMGANAINTSQELNTKSISADTAFTFNLTPTANTWFSLHVKNTDAAAAGITVTIPSSDSVAQGTFITSFWMGPTTEATLTWRYDGSAFLLYGEPWARSNLAATVDPGNDNDVDEGYAVGSLWNNTTSDQAFICTDATDGAAVWRQVGGSGGGSTGTLIDGGLANSDFTGTTAIDGGLAGSTYP